VAHHAYGVGSGGIAGVGSRQTILAYYSMRSVEFEQRVAAASAAGFDGIGFGVGEYLQLRTNGTSDDDLKQVLSQHNMRILELEALRLVDDKSALDFEHVARTFGVERVQVIAPFGANKDIDFDVAAKWLGALAERTADADVHYALEFLPPTKIPDIATAQNFVRRSGHPHVGLCVDTWHVFRGAGMSSLADLDYSLVKNIQVDDGTMTPSMDDYIQDCIHNRELLGAGEFDLEQFFERTPPNAPISVEIIDDDLDLIPAFERAQLQASSLQRLMARCYRQD
jgi:sugar phosphate isomerase/epimerase